MKILMTMMIAALLISNGYSPAYSDSEMSSVLELEHNDLDAHPMLVGADARIQKERVSWYGAHHDHWQHGTSNDHRRARTAAYCRDGNHCLVLESSRMSVYDDGMTTHKDTLFSNEIVDQVASALKMTGGDIAAAIDAFKNGDGSTGTIAARGLLILMSATLPDVCLQEAVRCIDGLNHRSPFDPDPASIHA